MTLATLILNEVFAKGQWIPEWQFFYAGLEKLSERRWHLSWVFQHEWEFTMQRKGGKGTPGKERAYGKTHSLKEWHIQRLVRSSLWLKRRGHVGDEKR